MNTKVQSWNKPEPDNSRSIREAGTQNKTTIAGSGIPAETGIWAAPELAQRKETANLDLQHPSTLYYLGCLVDIPQVVQIYVEKRGGESVKHWAILEDRDYDVMDRIYKIEEDTLDRFPMADLNFRVTVFTEQGPSVSERAEKIYDIK